MGLVEVLKERRPVTIPGKIALFAYYRERHEGLARFSRDDLEPYFAKAHEPPPRNYGRDFVTAVKRGWLHEDGADSYITSKGIEEVETGFPNERKWSSKTKKKSSSAGKKRKKQAAPKRRSGK